MQGGARAVSSLCVVRVPTLRFTSLAYPTLSKTAGAGQGEQKHFHQSWTLASHW
jgi:hypothetical protein